MANFEAFRRVISSSINLLFLKSVMHRLLTQLGEWQLKSDFRINRLHPQLKTKHLLCNIAHQSKSVILNVLNDHNRYLLADSKSILTNSNSKYPKYYQLSCFRNCSEPHNSKLFSNLNFPPEEKLPFSKNHELFRPVLPVRASLINKEVEFGEIWPK